MRNFYKGNYFTTVKIENHVTITLLYHTDTLIFPRISPLVKNHHMLLLVFFWITFLIVLYYNIAAGQYQQSPFVFYNI